MEKEAEEIVKYIAELHKTIRDLYKLAIECEHYLREMEKQEEGELVVIPFHVLDTMPMIG